jgi:hypothetical protein
LLTGRRERARSLSLRRLSRSNGAISLTLVRGRQIAGSHPPGNIDGKLAGISQSCLRNFYLDLSALLQPPCVPNRFGHAKPSSHSSARGGGQLGVGQGAGAYALPGQPERNRNARFVLLRATVPGKLVGLGQDIDGGRFRRPAIRDLSSSRGGIAPHVE